MLQNNEKTAEVLKAEKIVEQAKARLAEAKRKASQQKRKEENQHKYMMGGIVHKYFPECYQFDEQELNRIIASGMKSEQCQRIIEIVKKESAEKRENAVVKNKNGQKIKYKINRKPSSMKKLSKSGQYAAKKAEHKKSSVRAKVEHVFAVVKRLFGYRKTRYRGLRKQTAKLNIMFALANLYLADRKSLTA